MIFDSHAYCFESLKTPAGHVSSRARLEWVQTWLGSHHQPAWRVDNREAVDAGRMLLPPSGTSDGLPDVDLRADEAFGRVVWTVDDNDYTKQSFPPNCMAWSPHNLIAEMDYNNVDLALLHTHPMLGRDPDYLAKCVRAFPSRLRSMAPVDEWRIPTEPDEVVHELRRSIEILGLHAVKFNSPHAYLTGQDSWAGTAFSPFWEVVSGLGVPVFFTLGSPPTFQDDTEGYLHEIRTLLRWMEQFPDVRCAVTHGFPWRALLQDNRIVVPELMWAPFEKERCHLEVSFPIRIGDLFDYPFREMWPLLEESVSRIGADKLMWGSDMPFQNRICTYRQSREWIERYATLLSPAELAQIMGGTAARLLEADSSAQL